MTREVKIDNRTYTVAPLKFGQAREIFSAGKDAFEANCEMVAACLNNGESSDLGAPLPRSSRDKLSAGVAVGGNEEVWTAERVKDLPYPDGQALMLVCLEINGLKQVGES